MTTHGKLLHCSLKTGSLLGHGIIFPLVLVETSWIATLFGKSWLSCSLIVLSEKKCFMMFCDVMSFPLCVYVETLNFIASIPDPSILTLKSSTCMMQLKCKNCILLADVGNGG